MVASRSFRILSLFVALAILMAGCDQHITTITYTQVGACDAGAHRAWVFFEIGEINNVKPSVDFEFVPLRVSLDQGMEDQAPWPHYWSLSTEWMVGENKAVPSRTLVPHGTSKSLLRYMVFHRQTSDPDGSKEANETPYYFTYDKRDTDPPVLMIKSNASQSSWRDTSNCNDIIAPRQSCTGCHASLPMQSKTIATQLRPESATQLQNKK